MTSTSDIPGVARDRAKAKAIRALAPPSKFASPALSSNPVDDQIGADLIIKVDTPPVRSDATPTLAFLSSRELLGNQPRRVRHKKRGSTYSVITTGRLQVEGDLDMAAVVIYRADEDGSIWIRPEAEFNDGRFDDIAAHGGEKAMSAVEKIRSRLIETEGQRDDVRAAGNHELAERMNERANGLREALWIVEGAEREASSTGARPS